MSTTSAAKRRRRQYAKQNYAPLFGKNAPHYRKRPREVLAAREAQYRSRLAAMNARGSKKK